MFTMMKASDILPLTAKSLKSIIKIGLLSRPVAAPKPSIKGSDTIVVLGNGPSLNTTIAENGDELKLMPTVAVNFMANAPQFNELRPDYYVLADPHFFQGLENENVRNLWHNLSSVEWPLTLCVPTKRLATVKKLAGTSNRNICFATFNFVGAEGFGALENYVYRKGLAMPRPRNVLIPAIMCAIAAGYKNIYVAGADHSWMETIRVSDENHVISVQPHFYKDSKTELKRSETEYKGYHLHDILLSFYIAFRSYHSLQRFAKQNGIKIYNCTPGSYIDAFERKML